MIEKSIKVKEPTYERLAKYGTLKDSFDSTIARLLDIAEGYNKQ